MTARGYHFHVIVKCAQMILFGLIHNRSDLVQGLLEVLQGALIEAGRRELLTKKQCRCFI
jgi:hypothetical protein